MSLESVFANPPPLVGVENNQSGEEDKERSPDDESLEDEYGGDTDNYMEGEDSDHGDTEDKEEYSDKNAGDENEKVSENIENELQVEEQENEPSVGSGAEQDEAMDVQEVPEVPAELEEGELEDGELDDDDEAQEETEGVRVQENVQEAQEEVGDTQERNTESGEKPQKRAHSPTSEKGSEDSSAEEEEKEERKRKKKKKKKRKHREERDDKKKKKKRARYVDHDRIQDSYGDGNYNSMGWPGYQKASPGRNARSPPNEDRLPPGPYDSPYGSPDRERHTKGHSQYPPLSPPGPYDSPYESPPGPYDSPSDDDFGPSSRKYEKKSLLSMIEDEYLDDEDLYGKGHGKKGVEGKLRQLAKKKMYKEHAMNRKKILLETPKTKPICKFYADGKCTKGQNCHYSHEGIVRSRAPRLEVCKFYVSGVCQKGEDCLYMHETFPCKFFHVGQPCYQGENCKFSHEELTEEGMMIMDRITHNDDDEDSPKKSRKSLLGSPPRSNSLKKIPSLFDIQVFPPGQRPAAPGGAGAPGGPGSSPSHGGAGSGPPPPPGGPMHSPQPRPIRPGFYNEMGGSPARPPPPMAPPPMGPGFMGPMPPGPPMPPRPMMRPPMPGPPGPGPGPGPLPGGDAPGAFYNNFYQQNQTTDTIQSPEPEPSPSKPLPEVSLDGNNTSSDPGQVDNSASSFEIPAHLAPKQRELFLRIQQQQRTNVPEDETDGGDSKPIIEDDNWYSSDEEEGTKSSNVPPTQTKAAPSTAEQPNLVANLFKSLNQSSSNIPPVQPPVATQPLPPTGISQFDIATMLSVIRTQVSSNQGSAPAPVGVIRDPRMSQGLAPNDPRAKSSDPRPISNDPRQRSNDPRQRSRLPQNDSLSQDIESDDLPSNKVPRSHSGSNGHTDSVVSISPKASPNHPGTTGDTNNIPYMLYEVTTYCKPYTSLPSNIDLNNPQCKNDPRLQKQLGHYKTSKPSFHRQSSKSENSQKDSKASDPRLQRVQSSGPSSPKAADPRTARTGSDPKLHKTEPSTGNQSSKPVEAILKLLAPNGGLNFPPPTSIDPRVQRTLSAPTGISVPAGLSVPPALPQLLQSRPSDPRQAKPVSEIKAADPRLSRQISASTVGNNSDGSEGEQKTSGTMSHRNDPRFRKKVKPKGEIQSCLVTPSQPAAPAIPVSRSQDRGMEYSSPLGGYSEKSSGEQSGYGSYNRQPSNRNLQQKPNNSQKDSVRNSQQSIPPASEPASTNIPTSAAASTMIPILTEDLQVPTNLSAHNLKDMFNSIDPTASPFC